jgi:hypothetical protein
MRQGERHEGCQPSGQQGDGETIENRLPLQRAFQQQRKISKRESASGKESALEHEAGGIKQKDAKEEEQEREKRSRREIQVVFLHRRENMGKAP